MTQNYGEPDYWNARYLKDGDAFDWYQSFETLKSFLTSHCEKSDNILMLGCGNSLLSEEMYKYGYKTITNVDISDVVIKQCNERYPIEEYPGLIYQVANGLDMEDFKDETFDCVIDKGTFDTIMCGNDSGDAIKICEEVFRVLKKKGIYIVISYGKPEDRQFYFEQACDWNIEIKTIPKPKDYQENPDKVNYHYIYIMRKDQ
ncbi:hypothetical protein ACTFIU_007400 [Dictyostelium citrinum]